MLKRTTEVAAAYFKSQGCELLDEYRGCQTKMKYRCSCGNISLTDWNHFSQGKRCGKCAKYGQAKKRSVEEVRRIFAERGCEFLDAEFKGVHHKHRYRCKCGAESEVTFAAFHFQEQYCRACGLKTLAEFNRTIKKKVRRGPDHYMWQTDREKLRAKQLFKKKCCKMLSSSMKAVGRTKVGRTSDMLGYSPAALQEHITSHPNWDRVRTGRWAIDHIFPIQAFQDYGVDDIKLINCLENLRPLTQRENNQKRDRYDRAKFERWLKAKGITLG